MRSWKKPTPEQIDRAIALLGHTMHHRYFFDHLQNPEWIKPLFDKGYFSNPPPPERDEEKGTIGFPMWSESQYLARMAPLKPELVLDIIVKIPKTDNVRVYEDLADAALVMPTEISAKLIDKAKIWAKSPFQHLLSKKLGDLMAQLARAGMVDESIELARILLEVIPDPRRQKVYKDNEFSLPPEPTSRIDKWDYESILKKNIPDLVDVGGIPTFELLCDLLEQAIELSLSKGKESAPEDYSYIGRPAIEDHPQNRHGGIKDSIITSVRDASEMIIRDDGKQVRYLVPRLEARPWKIFKRIALYLLRRFHENADDIISQYLTKRELFDDPSYQHEHSMLLNSCFNKLSEKEREVIFQWIEDGPNLDDFKETEELHGEHPTEEEALNYKKYWQARRLAWFKASLPAQWKERYDELTAEIGEPEHPQFPSYSTTWVGPTSVKDADEIKKMTVVEITEFLTSWEPTGDHMTPSPEGFGRVLSSVISDDPKRFSIDAGKLVGLHPTYIRAFLSGLRDSLKKGKAIEWKPVLRLCEWVLEQPREFGENYKKYRDGDPHWGWARKNIADLFSAGFESTSQATLYEFRERIWKIIEQLTSDPEPTPEDESRYDSPNFDPANLSINTTRGEAMHAVLRYALWLRRSIEKTPESSDRIDRGFDEMPEVRTVLESHLDLSTEPSLAIRAVYGQWFPWLVLLDKEWSKRHTGLIFPADKELKEYWKAAWNTYIALCQAYDAVFDLLYDQYGLAIDNLQGVKEPDDQIWRPNVRLAEHLMVFYWRGVINFEKGENLFLTFWKKAPSDIRGRAIEYIGRSLFNTEGEVPADTISRLKNLWNWRFGEIQRSEDIIAHYPELVAFGWWFSSSKFDDSWSMKQLLKSVELSNKTDPDHRVLERLAELSKLMPTETVRCLDLLCKGDKEGWKIHGWKKHATLILTNALQIKGNAGRSAENLIHYLGSRGWLEFGELLKTI